MTNVVEEPNGYPVFVDGQKVGMASDVSYSIKRETSPLIAGPLTASLEDNVHLDEQVGTLVEGEQVEFSIDAAVPVRAKRYKDITTIEVAIPRYGEWEITEFVDVAILESNERGVEGMALSVNIGRTDYLGEDVDEPDRVSDPLANDDGFTTEVHE